MKGATSGTAAYERLRDAIVRLELAPGAAVSEAQLVDGFGFSKAAVRRGWRGYGPTASWSPSRAVGTSSRR